ncbi:DUF4396 domain-containing protein [Leifsonia sp. NPDC014704]|uniref:DUF4396 domain-containing protein n=1 Tax=unclassified Leifsonia TaxID=2663824 RepID=UPI000A1927C5|nr:multicopper oxidase domain-containing protein [Leifsonia sp. NCR5]
MLIQPIDYFLVVWFLLAGISTLYVAVDQFRKNPEPTVMKWGFILVTLYLGPIGLLLYVLVDKEPHPGEHEEFTKPLWKQGVGSTIHCVAGDATGIIAAAAITAVLGLPMWLDLIIEYLAGFAFGLLIFQSLFMKSLMGGTYLQNVRSTFLPEFISMNFMMAGMAPVMTLLMMGTDMRAMEPTELLFWGVMSVGVAAGFAFAYPANVWLVYKGLKHGLMTTRHAGTHNDGDRSHDQKAMPGMAGRGERGARQPTRPQVAAVAFVGVIALVAGISAPSNAVNMSLSAQDVGGAIMPPGMIMTRDTPGAAMRDMAAVDPRDVTETATADARGDRPLEAHMVGGVKEFDLTASLIKWQILPGLWVDAYAYNGQVPGPRLNMVQGDRVRINVTNKLPESTTVHWHGLDIPNNMDGPAQITQHPIDPGTAFTYEFTVKQAGTFFYHSHDHADRQESLGLYGALIIAPANSSDAVRADVDYTIQLGEWLSRNGLTWPAMPMEGVLANYFTINGKAYPATETIRMNVGQTLKVRFIGTNSVDIHPMHIHGGPFEVVARDGVTLAPSARFQADTVNVGPGQRYDVLWKARAPGKWLIHCHINHHTTNNNVEQDGAGGLTMVIDVTP